MLVATVEDKSATTDEERFELLLGLLRSWRFEWKSFVDSMKLYQ
jgi:hypothetical protein